MNEIRNTNAVRATAKTADARRAPPGPRKFRKIVPNLITVLALCLGLTAVRLAIEGDFELAVAAVLVAAVLDAVDGRLARLLGATSRFGAEFDSLADFVNFGVVPGLILYFWTLHTLGPAGWVVALVFATAMALRLARFNVMLDDPARPDWMGDFFTGMPAPAGAMTVMLPLYLAFSGVAALPAAAIAVYGLLLAALTISKVPVYSGKKTGLRLPRRWLPAALILIAAGAALLVSNPWQAISALTVAYLVSIPFGVLHYRRLDRLPRETIAEDHSPACTEEAADVLLPHGSAVRESRVSH